MSDSLTCALIGHLVGDYLLQNDWMALNKKKSSIACAVHCIIWATCVCLFAGWMEFSDSILAWVLLFSSHFIQDRTQLVMFWMTRINRQQAFATGQCAPWSIIVVDNVWHVVQIWAVWKLL